MKHFLFSCLILTILMLISGCAQYPKQFEVSRGTNISHWLSQSGRRGAERAAWFTEKDVAFVAELGFDHLRFPVDEEQLWDEAGNKETEAFELLHAGIRWCLKYKLRVIVDLHVLRSHHFNAEEIPLWTDPAAQEQFVQLWRELSEELGQYPTGMVAYELMNEAVAENPEDWNQLAGRAYKVIRENEPNRVIVLGSNRWQTVDTFDDLKVPENDPNILLSFHCYTPMLLTHYKASWWRGGGKYSGPVQYPGQLVTEEQLSGLTEDQFELAVNNNAVVTRDSLEALLEKPLKKRKETGLPLYCGEWGALPTTPEKDRLQWYADMKTNLEKHNIGWATWDYKGGFGIVDGEGKPKQALIDVLLQQ